MGGCPCDGGVCMEGMCSGGIDNALAERLHAAATVVRQQCINLTSRKARGLGGVRGPRPDGGDELGHPCRACVYTIYIYIYVQHIWHQHRYQYIYIYIIILQQSAFDFV